MSSMRAVHVSRSGGHLEIVERPMPEPGPGHVRIEVHASGRGKARFRVVLTMEK